MARDPQPAGVFPLVIEAAPGDPPLAAWLAARREAMLARLRGHRALLFRGFAGAAPDHVRAVLALVAGGAMGYVNRSTPRTEVGEGVYTATEYPPDQTIPLHNEMSYTGRWPRFVALACETPAGEGGETPIADSRAIYRAVPAPLRERFERVGVTYVRTMGQGIDLPWQDVFQTARREDVEAYCRARGIAVRWLDADVVQVRETRPAVRRHPETGEPVWFNQAHLFHRLAPGEELAAALDDMLGRERLPRHALYGDGDEISAADLAALGAAHAACEVPLAWRPGDVALLDNMAVAHGRRPFRGPRRVLFGMAGESGDVAQA